MIFKSTLFPVLLLNEGSVYCEELRSRLRKKPKRSRREPPEKAEAPPSPSSSLSRGASGHVGASLFRYQDGIVRIARIRTRLLVSVPLSHAAPNREKKAPPPPVR